jgi:hypothetical protein
MTNPVSNIVNTVSGGGGNGGGAGTKGVCIVTEFI